jgi:hypothetical protein
MQTNVEMRLEISKKSAPITPPSSTTITSLRQSTPACRSKPARAGVRACRRSRARPQRPVGTVMVTFLPVRGSRMVRVIGASTSPIGGRALPFRAARAERHNPSDLVRGSSTNHTGLGSWAVAAGLNQRDIPTIGVTEVASGRACGRGRRHWSAGG